VVHAVLLVVDFRRNSPDLRVRVEIWRTLRADASQHFTELPRKRDMLGMAESLVPEEHHLVRQQSRPYLHHGGGIQRLDKVYAGDLGTDMTSHSSDMNHEAPLRWQRPGSELLRANPAGP
jgi:hypothetical protein